MIKSFYQSLYKEHTIDDRINQFLKDNMLKYGDYEIETKLHNGDMIVIINYEY